MYDAYLVLIIVAVIIFYAIYALFDFATKGNLNDFLNRWLRKTLWIWLPFYAIWRLVKDMILKK